MGSSTLQRLLREAQMGFLLVDAPFDLPAFMITEDQFVGRGLFRVEQGRDQAMDLAGVGPITVMGARKLGQALGGQRIEAILDDAHLHRRQLSRMQGDQVAAIREDLLGLRELIGFEAAQGMGVALMDQPTEQSRRDYPAIEQDQHVRFD